MCPWWQEVTTMTITSRSEAMVLSRSKVERPLQVGDELLPQVEKYNYYIYSKMENENPIETHLT